MDSDIEMPDYNDAVTFEGPNGTVDGIPTNANELQNAALDPATEDPVTNDTTSNELQDNHPSSIPDTAAPLPNAHDLAMNIATASVRLHNVPERLAAPIAAAMIGTMDSHNVKHVLFVLGNHKPRDFTEPILLPITPEQSINAILDHVQTSLAIHVEFFLTTASRMIIPTFEELGMERVIFIYGTRLIFSGHAPTDSLPRISEILDIYFIWVDESYCPPNWIDDIPDHGKAVVQYFARKWPGIAVRPVGYLYTNADLLDQLLESHSRPDPFFLPQLGHIFERTWEGSQDYQGNPHDWDYVQEVLTMHAEYLAAFIRRYPVLASRVPRRDPDSPAIQLVEPSLEDIGPY